jgi:tRNA wybutosine-synthesizing protein 4
MLSNNADEKARFSAKDSLACKFSACKLGYFKDPYIEAVYNRLNPPGSSPPPARRSPIIHRGYYTRHEVFTKVTELFLQQTAHCPKRQILYLGAGYDTSPLITYHNTNTNVRTFEVDFKEVASKKFEIYSSIPCIVKLLEDNNQSLPEVPAYDGKGSGSVRKMETVSEDNEAETPVVLEPSCSSHVASALSLDNVFALGPLSLIGEDMRDAGAVGAALQSAGFDSNAHTPTLVLSECVLVYMNKETTMRLSSELAGALQLSDAVWMTYDMIHPDDTYGRNMIKNLQQVGFDIPGIKDFPTLDAQKARFLDCGWVAANSCSMRHYFDKLMDDSLKEKLHKVEMLDEVEEWNMLMDHYSLTIAMLQKQVCDFNSILNVIQ